MGIKSFCQVFSCRLIPAALTALILAAPVQAEDALSYEMSVSHFSDYMFRGVQLYDGVSIQPAAAIGYDLGSAGALSFSAWSHLSGEGGQSSSEKFTEIDYTAAYSFQAGISTLSLGHVWYNYPDGDDHISDTGEVFAGISLDTILTPTLTAFQDYKEYDAQYYELGISHTFNLDCLGEGFNATPFATFGFASNASKVYAQDGLVQTTFGVSFDSKLGDLVLTPSLNVTRESDDVASNEYWFGVTLAYASGS